MTVDASVQQLIDAALATVTKRIDSLTATVNTNAVAGADIETELAALTARVAALEAGTVPAPPPVTPPPASGIPAIPTGKGTMFKKNFADGTLAPFRAITYPNSHPGDLMIQYGRYVTDSAHISVSGGVLSLKATRNPDNTWSMAFVGTGLDGNGGTTNATYKFQYGTSRVCARFPGGTGKGDWRTLWLLVGDAWSSPEIDWGEVIGGKFTANLHGSSADGQKVNRAFDSNWHVFGIVKQPAYIALLLDEVEVGRANVAMSANMSLLADSKVGLSAPDASTPSPLTLEIAWWTVDPA